MDLTDEQRDEIDFFDAMKKAEYEFKWEVSGTGLVCGVMTVSVDPPFTPLEVRMDTTAQRIKVSAAQKDCDQIDARRTEQQCVKVTHLPPIRLHFQFPKNYPDKAPPTFNLSCSWLNFTQLSILCRELDKIWTENEGCVILYHWHEFLKTESCQALGFANATVSLEYQNPILRLSDWDPRGIQEMEHPLLVIPSLIEYNESKVTEEFQSNRFNCEICFLSELGSNCIKLRSCQHVHCKECMKNHIESKISDGTVNKVDCPASECKELIPPDIVRSLVPPKLFERYDDLLLQRTLDTMTDIVYCPRQSCLCVTIKEEDSNMAVCPRCKFSFCCLCKRTWHGISPCKLLPDNILQLKELYESGDAELKVSLEQQYGRKHLIKAFQEIESNTWLKQFSKKCPNCQSSIEKSHGCNKMTCTCCHANFCWLCETLLSGHNPYAHFHFGSSSCAGKLFDGVIPDEDDL